MTTKKLGNGWEVLAKNDKEYGLCAITYVNITQAEKAKAKLGEGWSVKGHRPFYVVKDQA